ncbi:CaiB/BaiF CoA transferase family protein [Peribacillus frigoritolerans]|uniref:CaiB/BaiF CoA transferase family protein n=1 Tax=Peribacillus frigoritolerans TaxID=450367 RepID=UPI0020BE35F0|nr:CaiB/BaiF CoA-transferase family protein [Peribacillus frigoritolerans]
MTLLKDLKILDFSALLPGPYATMILSDLGADVLRVEAPSKSEDDSVSAKDGYLNRSKKSIALNLKVPETVEVVKQLVQDYDIVLEQFRPGVMDRLGLGYEVLKEINPKLIYCSLTGFGQTGPYRRRPGHDNNYLAMSGIVSYSGQKGQAPPLIGTQVADLAGGSMNSVISILAAFIHREQTGEGQYIDISMTDCAFALNALFGSEYLVSGVNPEQESTLLNGGTFYDYYETKDGRYISVGSIEPQFRKLLCEGIGRSDLFELSMSQKPGDEKNFKGAVQSAFLTKTFDEWNQIFGDLEACVEPVLSFGEAAEHPQLKERKMVVEVAGQNGKTVKQIACPIKTSIFTPEYKHIGSIQGQDTNEILKGLDITDDTIAEWRNRGIIN